MPTEFYFQFPWVCEIMMQIGEFWNYHKCGLIPQLLTGIFIIQIMCSFWALGSTIIFIHFGIKDS
jgi:hypothetical protein